TDLCKTPNWHEAETLWNKQVGLAQRLLPAHVVNEYCHPYRLFHPCMDFTKATLPRTRNTEEGEWYTNGKLGESAAYFRSLGGVAAIASGEAMSFFRDDGWHVHGLLACLTLLDTRVQQRNQLFAELSVQVQAQRKAVR